MKSKHLLWLYIAFCSLFISKIQNVNAADEYLSAHCIDLSRVSIPNQFEYAQIIFANSAFNGAPEIASFVCMLKNRYNIDAAIETGSQYGYTTSFLASIFNEVHTVEIVSSTYEVAQNNLRNFSNTICHLGCSTEVLKNILPGLESKPLLFYLDAHWEAYWPLRDEIEEISKTHRDNCIIMIDDIKVPGRPDIGFDWSGGDECSYEYVKDKLEKAFSEYNFYYVLPKRNESKAKLVIIPKKWAPL